MQQTGLVPSSNGKIRNATLLDASELSRLIGKASTPRADALDLLGRGHLLVLELGDTLAAAVHIDVADNQATVNLLVVDPALSGRHIAERMSGVAHALCEAYGYDVPGAIVGPPRGAVSRGPR
jgi:N-acetylglutamate synthase-like GNAT family acetyltransferase